MTETELNKGARIMADAARDAAQAGLNALREHVADNPTLADNPVRSLGAIITATTQLYEGVLSVLVPKDDERIASLATGMFDCLIEPLIADLRKQVKD